MNAKFDKDGARPVGQRWVIVKGALGAAAMSALPGA